MSPPDNLQSEALAAVVDHYRWTKVAIIVEKSSYGNIQFIVKFLKLLVCTFIFVIIKYNPIPNTDRAVFLQPRKKKMKPHAFTKADNLCVIAN